MTDITNILSKIKKCLALSESSNVHEAAAALRQAQKLMELHGITESALGASEITEANLRSKTAVSKVNPWELRLISTIAKAFGCQLIWSKGSSYGRCAEDIYGKYIFVGLKQQVPVAIYTAEVLLKRLTKARADFIKTDAATWDRSSKTKAADSFCLGWVFKISETVIDFAGSDKLDQAIEDYKLQTHGQLKNSKASAKGISNQFISAGQNAAAGESLFRPMSESAKVRQLT